MPNIIEHLITYGLESFIVVLESPKIWTLSKPRDILLKSEYLNPKTLEPRQWKKNSEDGTLPRDIPAKS